jgi:hypothetical protein
MRDDLLQMVPEGPRDIHGTSTAASTKIDAVVFAGGVCHSVYLQEVVEAYLQMVPQELADTGLRKLMPDSRFLFCRWPHLCVARGLVYARIDELKAGDEDGLMTMLGRLRSRFGYSSAG